MDNRDYASYYQLTVLDIVVLVYHVTRGAKHPSVGFEDANRTKQDLIHRLARDRTSLPKPLLESALWSCNLMNEMGEFWSPNDESFRAYVRRILKDDEVFNEIYNLILKKSGDAKSKSNKKNKGDSRSA